MWLFALFVAIPIIEIGLFIQVGGWLGLWPTLAIVVVTALLGTALLRSQGAMAMQDLRRNMAEMRDPSESLAHGAMILFAGALLLTPGFFTDAVGFALMVPAIRLALFRALRSRMSAGTIHMQTGFGPTPHPGQGPYDPNRGPADRVIDGDFEEVPPRSTPKRPSGWTDS